jgi:opacity protein-like surface antigen
MKGTTVLVFLVLGRAILAGEPTNEERNSTAELFQPGKYEFSFTSGPKFSPFVAKKHRPTVDYTLTEAQLGCMLSNVRECGWFSGSFELAGGAFGGAIFEGPGGYVAGGTTWVRYNFALHNERLVPFFQAGAGLTSTDTASEIVGQYFNFNLDLGAGFRCLIARNWSVNLEYRYQHISNANLSDHNVGINAHGPILGVSHFF